MFSRAKLYGLVGAAAIGCIAASGAMTATSANAASGLGPDVSCTSTSPCVSDKNSGSGAGLASLSLLGTGLTGSTQFHSTSSTSFAAGVLGTDASTGGVFDAGVEGTTKRGIGVLGVSKNSTGIEGITNATSVGQDAILGIATAGGIGVEGKSFTGASSIGVLGQSNTVGLEGFGSAGSSTSILAQGTGGNLFVGQTNFSTVLSVDSAGNLNTTGNLTASGVGGTFGDFQTSAVDARAIFAAAQDEAIFGESSDPSSLFGAITASGQGGLLFQGFTGLSDVFDVDGSGNVRIAGEIFTAGPCSTGCITHGPNQKRVVSYAPRESQPTMEDFGEAQLVNGEARVALEASFASVINRGANYLVFVTPEGDCNGLFIAGKSRDGFAVRELRGGRSTIAFEYRIVAKPFGDQAARLPAIILHQASTLRQSPKTHNKTM